MHRAKAEVVKNKRWYKNCRTVDADLSAVADPKGNGSGEGSCPLLLTGCII